MVQPLLLAMTNCLAASGAAAKSTERSLMLIVGSPLVWRRLMICFSPPSEVRVMVARRGWTPRFWLVLITRAPLPLPRVGCTDSIPSKPPSALSKLSTVQAQSAVMGTLMMESPERRTISLPPSTINISLAGLAPVSSSDLQPMNPATRGSAANMAMIFLVFISFRLYII